jgi:16S rRNA (adenine1518-N6/adenine1519-N6)-dimethyltransferase
VTTSRARLSALGLRPRKGLSQSFLEDERVAAAIVRAARLDRQRDEVLEVGPGLGVLTERLLRAAKRVVAVELDLALADWLRVEFGSIGLTVQAADILQVDPSAHFDKPFVVVANLPYHVATAALRHLLDAGPPHVTRLIVMLQAEVADRIIAPPGQLSALAVGIQAQANVRVVRRVPKSAFYPRPKVDSAVLSIEPLAEHDRPIARAEHADFVRFAQAGFKQPRKTLANSLAEGLQVEKAVALQLLGDSEVDAKRRPQELCIDDWVRLFRNQPQ